MTKFQVLASGGSKQKSKTHLVFIFEKGLKLSGVIDAGALAAAKMDRFHGEAEKTLLLHSANRRLLLVGVGPLNNATLEAFRRAAGCAAKILKNLSVGDAIIHLPSEEPKNLDHVAQAGAVTEGLALGAYSYDDYRGKKPQTNELTNAVFIVRQTKLVKAIKEIKERAAVCEAVRFTRDLVNRPPSDTFPEAVAKEALKIGRSSKNIRVKVLHKKQIEEKKMVGLLGVNRGSHNPPVFLDLHYKPAGAKKKVVLVGKGVTFDSGGLSLKPAKSMEDMKCDMAGCASVLGMILAASKLNLKVEIHALCAVTENLINGNAMKPGDVLRYNNGVAAEVLNTDAEGRLVLADALIYACKLKPDQILDFATLTGAAIAALGMNISVVLGDPRMAENLKTAGEKTGEAMWQLPLPEAYKSHIASRLADIKNIGHPGEAGTITAALFLQRFVDIKKWLHVDIAGPAFLHTADGIHPAQATGNPVRAVIEYLKKI